MNSDVILGSLLLLVAVIGLDWLGWTAQPPEDNGRVSEGWRRDHDGDARW